MNYFTKIAILSLLISMQFNTNCSHERTLQQIQREASITASLIKITTDIPTILKERHDGPLTSQAIATLTVNKLTIRDLPPLSENRHMLKINNKILLKEIQEINSRKPSIKHKKCFRDRS